MRAHLVPLHPSICADKFMTGILVRDRRPNGVRPCKPGRPASTPTGRSLYVGQAVTSRVLVFVVSPGKVGRNEGVQPAHGPDRLRGQGKAAVPGRRPPWSQLIASSAVSGRRAQLGVGGASGSKLMHSNNSRL